MNPGDPPFEIDPADDGERTMIRTARGRLPLPATHDGWVHDLVYTDDSGAPQRLRLEPGVAVRIGRRLPCDVILRDSEISGVHCQVVLAGEQVTVSDQGSTNGSFVDGRRVLAPELLPHGGVLQVGRQIIKHEFRDGRELAQSQELDRDLGRASQYVQSLLPPPLRHGAVQVEWVYEPSARVGGDGFGYHALDAHRLVMYLVDVSGHGVGAAMHGVSVLSALRQQTLPETDFANPAQVLSRLNAMFQMDRHAGMFFTIWYGVHDARTGSLDYASGGHHPAFVLGPGAPPQPLQTRNLVIGAMPDAPFTAGRAALMPGQRLYIFSDGVFEIEPRDGSAFGLPEFLGLLGGTPPLGVSEPEHLFGVVRGLAPPGPLDDDFSLMVARAA